MGRDGSGVRRRGAVATRAALTPAVHRDEIARALPDCVVRPEQTEGPFFVARFTTIFPGWYRGRAVHVHFKVRTDAGGQPYEFTSQLYFDEALIDQVHAQAPYAARGRRSTTNADDRTFRDGGEILMARVSEAGAGYAATFDLGLDLTDAATGRSDGGGRRRGPVRI